MLTIDIETHIIPPRQRAWRLFPGAGYKFIDTFISRRVGFLDLPGFQLPEELLSEVDDIIPRIAASAEYKRRIQSNENNNPVVVPNYKDFAGARVTRFRGALRRGIINFFEEAIIGDVVLMPSPLIANQIYIGEILSDISQYISFETIYDGASFPAREIFWRHKIEQNAVSKNLISSLRNQHPFTMLNEELTLEAFSLNYKSLYFKGIASALVFNKNTFTAFDASFLGLISKLAMAANEAIDKKLALPSLIDIVLRGLEDNDYASNLAVDVHSPGLSRYSSYKKVPLIIMSLMVCFFAAGDANTPEEAQAILNKTTVINSAAHDDRECALPVQAATDLVLQTLPLDQTWRICQQAKLAREKAGLRPSAKRVPD